MSAQPERSFGLPPEPRAPWGAWLVAAVLQVGLMFLLISEPRNDHAPEAFRALLPTALQPVTPTVTMRYQPGATGRKAIKTLPASAPPRSLGAVVPRVAQSTAPSSGEAAPVGIAVLPHPDSASAPPSENPFRRHFGTGALWVRPLPVTPEEIAQQLSGESRKQIADSVLTAIIQGYLDRMAEERAHQGPPLPSWVTSIGGKKVGIDPKWVYIGPIKIPTALLAFLPIKGGNPTMADYNKKLSAMREDLFEAARRSANYDEFKKAVQELRQETERKHDYEKNRRTAPDSGHGE